MKYPIIIDQNYCDIRGACEEQVKEVNKKALDPNSKNYSFFRKLNQLILFVCFRLQSTGVQISNVAFMDFYGTSSTDVAVNLNCSRAVACTGIWLTRIQLKSAIPEHSLTSSCTNAYGYSLGMVEPSSCLQI